MLDIILTSLVSGHISAVICSIRDTLKLLESDNRLKEHLEPIEDELNKVEKQTVMRM